MRKTVIISALILSLAILSAGSVAIAQTSQSEHINMLKNTILRGYENAYTGNQIISEIEERLIPIRQKIDSLKEQINLLDEEYELTRKKIQDVEKQIAVRKKEIEIINMELAKYDDELTRNQKLLIDLGSLIYQNQKKYIEFDGNEKKINIIKLLLSSSIISDISKNNDYLRRAGILGADILETTIKLTEEKKLMKKMLDDKTVKLEDLQKRLDVQKKIIATQKEAKQALITFTKGSEEAYESLIKEARKEQEEILKEIQGYQSKLKEIENILNKNTTEPKTVSQALFDWPVDPTGGITAYFKDESYESRFGIVHNAIDIRIPEGTEIQTPLDGYVYKIHDGGKGYSYLILAHRNNTLTVYGHVLEFSAKEGDIVKKGEVIGLSGGTPGSPGAGYLTTGPHLHFEIYENGKHIDPLSVLDLTKLPIKYIPSEYL